MMPSYWLSSRQMTVIVTTDADDRIIVAAPIVRSFLGQPLGDLVEWMRPQGGLRWQRFEEKQ